MDFDRNRIERIGKSTDLILLAILDELKQLTNILSQDDKENACMEVPELKTSKNYASMTRQELFDEIKKLDNKPKGYTKLKSEKLIKYLEEGNK